MSAAFMLMPEASVHENRLSRSRERNIRFAGQLGPVKPISITQAIKELAYDHFGVGIPRSDPAHVLAAPIRIDRIHVAPSGHQLISIAPELHHPD
jgi:hypothetical protein